MHSLECECDAFRWGFNVFHSGPHAEYHYSKLFCNVHRQFLLQTNRNVKHQIAVNSIQVASTIRMGIYRTGGTKILITVLRKGKNVSLISTVRIKYQAQIIKYALLQYNAVAVDSVF